MTTRRDLAVTLAEHDEQLAAWRTRARRAEAMVDAIERFPLMPDGTSHSPEAAEWAARIRAEIIAAEKIRLEDERDELDQRRRDDLP